MEKTYIAVEPIRHNGKLFAPGSKIKLDDAEAVGLLALSAIEAAETAQPEVETPKAEAAETAQPEVETPKAEAAETAQPEVVELAQNHAVKGRGRR